MVKEDKKQTTGLFKVFDKKKRNEYKNLSWEDAVRVWNTLDKAIILEQPNEKE